CFCTLGLYLPWYYGRLRRYVTANIWIGGEDIGMARGFVPVSPEDCVVLMFQRLLGWLSLGLLSAWTGFYQYRYFANNTRFVGTLDVVNLTANAQRPRQDPSTPDPSSHLPAQFYTKPSPHRAL